MCWSRELPTNEPPATVEEARTGATCSLLSATRVELPSWSPLWGWCPHDLQRAQQRNPCPAALPLGGADGSSAGPQRPRVSAALVSEMAPSTTRETRETRTARHCVQRSPSIRVHFGTPRSRECPHLEDRAEWSREMPHPADFVDAHHRHRADAELLFEHHRWANADRLYGFSAECGTVSRIVYRKRCPRWRAACRWSVPGRPASEARQTGTVRRSSGPLEMNSGAT